MQFSDRQTAGRLLGEALSRYRGIKSGLVVAIPRSGVIVGAEVARYLNLPLDVIVTKKIGSPKNSEYAVGSVTSTGQVLFDDSVLRRLGVDVDDLHDEIESLKALVQERTAQLRNKKAPIDIAGKEVILVDDGIATGHTVNAAVQSIRALGPSRIILAAPVASEESIRFLEPLVDEVEVLHLPVLFDAVAQFYEDFAEITDSQAEEALYETHSRSAAR